uniref:Uncharacterized protein n=1 Tax=Mantoniella antarctica TaxID=81844 RepID=A0A7S0SD11_9CHLO|mmetsp:Transcript_18016/g.44629  ORF Transcript_18016/g.44629 Transcript_18016/m.44629 type:complete len:111 (+) Transcript_18016:326-658(+)
MFQEKVSRRALTEEAVECSGRSETSKGVGTAKVFGKEIQSRLRICLFCKKRGGRDATEGAKLQEARQEQYDAYIYVNHAAKVSRDSAWVRAARALPEERGSGKTRNKISR